MTLSPSVSITVRRADARDVPFVDALATRLGLHVDAASELRSGRAVFVADVTRASGAAPAGPDELAISVGFATFQLAGDELEVYDVGVVPEFQRRGVARRLVEAALGDLSAADALQVGPTVAFLEVRRGNAAAIALYASLGFEFVGERRRYYADGEDALIGRLELSRARDRKESES